MSASSPQIDRKRLDSWKEIALFFGRDERTVNRWEKDLGLPVHRLPGTKGRVYAFTDELSAWLATPRNAGAALREPDSESSQENGQPGAPQPEASSSRVTEITVRHNPTVAESPEGSRGTQREALGIPSVGHYLSTIRLLAVAILVLAAVALVLFRPGTNSTPKTVRPAASSAQQTSPNTTVMASTPSHDPEAEQLYLKGRFYWNKRTPEDLNKALDYFMQAVVHDPDYSQAYVGMADCYNLMREYTLMPSGEAYQRALAAAKKAVELDAQSSEAHASLAYVSFFGMWDVATGEREFRRAIDLNPNNPAAHHWYANALMALRRFPESLAEIDRAQSLDPASTSILADKGDILFHAGKRDEALTLLKQMESREPAFRSSHVYLKDVYLAGQDYPNFVSELRKDALLVHDDSAIAIATAAEKGFASSGARGMFEAILQVQKKFNAQHSVSPMDLALTSARLGNKPEALRYLNDAYQQRDSSLLFVQIYPEFNTLHDEPAYNDLLARMNLPVRSAP
jgi:tetratricopeptide (TPR) repeat protein